MIWIIMFGVLSLYGADSYVVTVVEGSLPTSNIYNGSSLSSHEELAEFMISNYFQGNGQEVRNAIRPFLISRLQTRRPSSLPKFSQSIKSSDSSDKSELSMADHSFIAEHVSSAIEEAILEERRRSEKDIRRAKGELPTTKVTIIAGVFSLLTAAITAGITLGATLLTK